MAKAYRLTPRRRAALRKAQLASARKRKGKGRKYAKRAAIASGAVLGTGLVARHTLSNSKITVSRGPVRPQAHSSKITGSGRKRGNFGRSSGIGGLGVNVGYEHHKLTRDVLGSKMDSGPRSVMRRRPASAVDRRRMRRHNVPMTGNVHDRAANNIGSVQHSAMPRRAAQHIGVAGRTIGEAEAMRRTASYMDSLKPRQRTTRRRNNALAFYRSQPRYTGTGTFGKRVTRKQARANTRAARERKR